MTKAPANTRSTGNKEEEQAHLDVFYLFCVTPGGHRLNIMWLAGVPPSDCKVGVTIWKCLVQSVLFIDCLQTKHLCQESHLPWGFTFHSLMTHREEWFKNTRWKIPETIHKRRVLHSSEQHEEVLDHSPPPHPRCQTPWCTICQSVLLVTCPTVTNQ